MKISDHFNADRAVLLKGRTKAEALAELVSVVAPAAGVSTEDLSAAVAKREQLMSTGIGQGLAVPHVRMPGVRDLVMAVGVCPEGLTDYESLDGHPVQIVVFIAAPAGQHEAYLRLLSIAVDILKAPGSRDAILAAASPEAIHEVLTEG